MISAYHELNKFLCCPPCVCMCLCMHVCEFFYVGLHIYVNMYVWIAWRPYFLSQDLSIGQISLICVFWLATLCWGSSIPPFECWNYKKATPTTSIDMDSGSLISGSYSSFVDIKNFNHWAIFPIFLSLNLVHLIEQRQQLCSSGKFVRNSERWLSGTSSSWWRGCYKAELLTSQWPGSRGRDVRSM